MCCSRTSFPSEVLTATHMSARIVVMYTMRQLHERKEVRARERQAGSSLDLAREVLPQCSKTMLSSA